MSESAKKTGDEKIIEEALKRFKYCEEAEQQNRARALDDLKFSLGEQWPDAVRRARENDPNGARPCLTVNKLGQYVRQVVNDSRQNKPAIKVRPVDSGADPEVADKLQGLVRHIEDNSRADIAYDTAIEFAVRAGLARPAQDQEHRAARRLHPDRFRAGLADPVHPRPAQRIFIFRIIIKMNKLRVN